MKKSLIAAGALVLLSSAGAQAADIVTYQEQPAAAVAAAPSQVNWNGLYIGGTIGGSWANGRNKVHDDWHQEDLYAGVQDNTSGKTHLFNKKVNPNSFIGGLYAGYNFQPGFLSQSALKDVVFGLETDWLWNGGGKSAKGTSKLFTTDIHDDFISPDWDGDRYSDTSVSYKTRIRQEWNGATRLRAGYALGAEGRILPYIAGGVSYAKIKAKSYAIEIDEQNPDERDTWGTSKSKTRAGWNIGAGVDYVPPILSDHLVLRAEYRFTDFGTMKLKQKYTDEWENTPGDETYGGGSMNQKVKFNQNDFRVGVAYKF